MFDISHFWVFIIVYHCFLVLAKSAFLDISVFKNIGIIKITNLSLKNILSLRESALANSWQSIVIKC